MSLVDKGLYKMKRDFGPIENVAIGSIYKTREELRNAGIHMPLQGGISGSASEGAESIVLSGGYPDDEFNDDSILYTGSGKRDEHTGLLTEDQKLIGGNRALAKSCDDGLPVRVVQALGVRRKQLPTQGYRYEGIYYIENYSRVTGVDGYKIWQFHLIRQSKAESAVYDTVTHKRVLTSVQRLVRNTLIANTIKKMYEYKCQICGLRIETPSGYYSEGAHIKPLGANHNGADSKSNLLCLCPNHHVMLDYGAIYIDEDFYVFEREDNRKIGRLNVQKSHLIDKQNLIYQREIFNKDGSSL
jgi:putative restriction endonuclease